MAILIAIVVPCAVVSGCKYVRFQIPSDVASVVSSESMSPDGVWLASARSERTGGPGTASGWGAVYLKEIDDTNSDFRIVVFQANPDFLKLKMYWENASHLVITYEGLSDISLQVVRTRGVDITLRNVLCDEGKEIRHKMCPVPNP
jgi:hypothetical protein